MEAGRQNVSDERDGSVNTEERSELLVMRKKRSNSSCGGHTKQLTPTRVLIKREKVGFRVVLLQIRLIIQLSTRTL